MVYNHSSRKVRIRRSGRRRGKSRSKSVAKIATRVHHRLEPTKELRNLTNKQMKTSVLQDGFMTVAISNISKGNQLNQRDADAMYLSYVHFVLTAANQDDKCKRLRVMLVRDKSPAQALDATNWTNLYRNELFADSTATNTQKDLCYLLNQNILEVKFDKQYVLKPRSEGSLVIKQKVRIGQKVLYNPVTASSAPTSGAWYIIVNLIEQDTVTDADLFDVACMTRSFWKAADHPKRLY